MGGNMYNMLCGYNPSCFLFLPMLGRKKEDYPRFRDCFITDEGNIGLYTRVGGNNRHCGFGEEELYKDPNFLTTYDDDYDDTYATYEFSVPEKYKKDFDCLASGNWPEVSDEYNILNCYVPSIQKNLISTIY